MKSRKGRRGDPSPQPMGSSPAAGAGGHLVVQPLLLTLPQVAQQLGLSQTRVYQLVAQDGLPTIKIGRSTRVMYTSLMQWVVARESEQSVSRLRNKENTI